MTLFNLNERPLTTLAPMVTKFTISTLFSLVLLVAAGCNISDEPVAGPQISCPDGQTLCAGACQDLDTSPQACGACGNVCESGSVCADGACQIVCPAGYVACDGACVNPTNNPEHCGAEAGCVGGEVCTDDLVCSSGACVLVCAGGTIECDGRCIDPATDPNFCGANGNCSGGNVGETCEPTETCDRGSCASTCTTGTVGCDGGCIDPSVNPRFCGASNTCQGDEAGVMCPPGEICRESSCVTSCGADRLLCDDACIDPATDPNFCGASGSCTDPLERGTVCAADELCYGGECSIVDFIYGSPYDPRGVTARPIGIDYQIAAGIPGVLFYYTLDGSDPAPGQGSTQMAEGIFSTGLLSDNQNVRYIYDIDGRVSSVQSFTHQIRAADIVAVPEGVSVNGGGPIARVAAGSNVEVTYSLRFYRTAVTLVRQVVVFADEVGQLECEEIVSPPPGDMTNPTSTFTAPNEPGTYYVRIATTEFGSCAEATGPYTGETIAMIVVE